MSEKKSDFFYYMFESHALHEKHMGHGFPHAFAVARHLEKELLYTWGWVTVYCPYKSVLRAHG